MGPKVRLQTLGCKVNQYDAAALKAALERAGFTSGGPGDAPDVVLVNSCTVTASTDRQNRQLIRRLKKAHPEALLVVTGCQAEVFPEALKRMDEVDLVVGNREKARLPHLILLALNRGAASALKPPVHDFLWEDGVDHLPGRTRAFLHVQDGCEAFCTYCIVPYARGPSRSRPLSSLIEEVRRMERAGIRELVLTGIHLGLYGRDLSPPAELPSLLDEILGGCAIPRIRLSSIEPLEVDDPLLSRMKESSRICPHLHVPLQSADDELLRRMNRPYSAAQYLERIHRALEAIPDLTLGCDVIVGFPGETQEHFLRTRRFLERLPFTYLHVFPFSSRPGTAASGLTDRVDPKEVKARSRLLREMSQVRRAQVAASYVGRVLSVLVERPKERREGWLDGLTPNYLRVLAQGGVALRNQIVPVHTERVEGSLLIGRLV